VRFGGQYAYLFKEIRPVAKETVFRLQHLSLGNLRLLRTGKDGNRNKGFLLSRLFGPKEELVEMNKKELVLARYKVYHSYHVPGMGHQTTRKTNAIFISPSNGLAHECKKTEICWKILKSGGQFITEAVSNSDNRRVDIVALDPEGYEGHREIEIVDTCLTKMTQDAIDRGTDILVVKV
jgi:hypothetical protein